MTATKLNLEFGPKQDDLGKGKELRDGLSVALQIGNTLWVANDESISLERLTLGTTGRSRNFTHAGQHKQFPLVDYLQLPAASGEDPAKIEEVDLEGLAYDDGYLWLVGSHSLKRNKPALEDDDKQARKQLAELSVDGNRYLLARIPVTEVDGSFALSKEASQKGQKKRIAAQLRGNAQGNDLMTALRSDKHLGPFLAIPGKDNGFDIEGLAVVGQRLFLGLRGPVLGGWAVILEVELIEDKKQPSILRLNPIGPKQRPYRKHFIQLGGLGIRDICVQGADLLILAGPTMLLDGPVSVLRWVGGAAPKDEMVVPAQELKHVLDVPNGKGVDHAEGITLFSANGDTARSLLVVYDSASEQRQLGESTAAADVFLLPRTAKPKKS